MKHLIIVLLVLSFFNAKSQIKSEYTGIVQLDSTQKKTQIYRSAKQYFVDNFKSANDVIQYQDESEGKLIGKGNFVITKPKWLTTIQWTVSYSTSIECKDGRYRYKLYDIIITQDWLGGNGVSSQTKELTINQALEETQKGQLKTQASEMISLMTKFFENEPNKIKESISKSSLEAKEDF